MLLTSPCIMCRQREREREREKVSVTECWVQEYWGTSLKLCWSTLYQLLNARPRVCTHIHGEVAPLSRNCLTDTVHGCSLLFRKLHEHDTSPRPSQALTTLPISCHFQVRVDAVNSFRILNLDFGCISHHPQACSIAHQAYPLRLESPKLRLVTITNYEA